MGILSGKDTEKTLLKLMQNCESFSVVVAWATPNFVFSEIQKHVNKLDQMIVGIDFYQTHPDVLNWMQKQRHKQMFVGKSKNGGIFHPKIFLFKFKDKISLVIGSPNLTAAAYSINEEACVHIKIKEGDNSATNLIATWVKNGVAISNFDIPAYWKEYLIKGRAVRQVLRTRICKEFRENPDLLVLSFNNFYHLCTMDPYHYFDARLKLLNFCAKTHFTHDEFCCVAGIVPLNPIHGIDYGLFGGMSADAAFRDTVRDPNHWQSLNTLYGSLPQTGPINKKNASTFISAVETHVNNCFGTTYGKLNHLSAASRLLAMKRPDLFFCVNGANSKRLAGDLGVTVSGKANGIKTVKGYLSAAEQLQKSTWGTSSAPTAHTNPNMQPCWAGRVAMIDSIYYEPE